MITPYNKKVLPYYTQGCKRYAIIKLKHKGMILRLINVGEILKMLIISLSS